MILITNQIIKNTSNDKTYSKQDSNKFLLPCTAYFFFPQLVIDYFSIWPLFQWVTSLLTLILMYWASGYFYNKYLAEEGGWMDAKARIIMILVDLILNFALGIYYMNYRDTFIGALMVQCPIFCSPLFWLVELLCFFLYTRFFLKNSPKKKKEIEKL